ncbi:MAG: histidine triad nucleotide-binding protein [Chloroflexota bacterium]
MTQPSPETQPWCVFCRIVTGQAPAEVLYRDDLVTAFRDIHPQAPSHVLIVPNRHIPAVAAAGPGDVELLARLVSVANHLAAEEGIAASGYRLVINNGPQAGQSVAHLHLHLLGGRRMGWPPG